MLLKFEAEDKSLRPGLKGPDAEVKCYEAEAKILASRPVWPQALTSLVDTAARPEQAGRSRLPEPGTHRRQAAASLAIHWLPLRQRVTYKLAVLTHKVRTTATPTYLSELVQTHAPPRTLRSSDALMLVIPRIHTDLARRAFSVAAPSTWNSLLYLLTFDCAITFSLSNGT